MDEGKLIYSSSNGDRWVLVRDSTTGHPLVQHEPNGPSGGRTHAMTIAAFLEGDRRSPQHQAFLELVATLLEPEEEAAPLSR